MQPNISELILAALALNAVGFLTLYLSLRKETAKSAKTQNFSSRRLDEDDAEESLDAYGAQEQQADESETLVAENAETEVRPPQIKRRLTMFGMIKAMFSKKRGSEYEREEAPELDDADIDRHEFIAGSVGKGEEIRLVSQADQETAQKAEEPRTLEIEEKPPTPAVVKEAAPDSGEAESDLLSDEELFEKMKKIEEVFNLGNENNKDAPPQDMPKKSASDSGFRKREMFKPANLLEDIPEAKLEEEKEPEKLVIRHYEPLKYKTGQETQKPKEHSDENDIDKRIEYLTGRMSGMEKNLKNK